MKNMMIENMTKIYGDKQLFKGISFSIAEKDRIGLIGVNGAGKTSLLKILAGIDVPDSGEIVRPKDYKVAYSAQEPELDENLTILEQVFSGDTPVLRLVKEYEKTIYQLNQNPSNSRIQDYLFELQRKMDATNSWDVQTNAATILGKLGIENINKKISELSGGQKKRVALAQILLQEVDLLILDEPTNHLDYESVKWLEDYLSRFRGSIFLVTHDRYFLDRVTNRILELDEGNLYSYKGNYSSYLEAKAIREENETASFEKKKNLYRRELEWIERGAKARSTKQKARIERFENLKGQLSVEKSREKLEISLRGSRLGKQVFEVRNGCKTFGSSCILRDFNLLVKRGDRIGIVGKNGTGKSTLLNILARKISLDSGDLITGQTVKIAYYTQENEEMDEKKRIIEYLKETAELISTSDGNRITAAQMLEKFLFPSYTHGTLIGKLSGGEKRRLQLLKILMGEPNVLLLDEPTNNLDVQTLTILEDYLKDFPGVVIAVSHDRYFLDKIAEQLLVFKGNGKIDSFYGNYSEYLESQNEDKTIEKTKKVEIKPSREKEKPKKKKMTYKERIEWENISEQIQDVENRLTKVREELGKTGSDFEKAHTLMKEEIELNEQLDRLIERWTYLADLAEI